MDIPVEFRLVACEQTVRILVVHPGVDFSVADVYQGWAKAFETLGCEVKTYDLHDRLAFFTSVKVDGKPLTTEAAIEISAEGLKARCYEYQPDLVFVISGFFVTDFIWNLWKARKQKTAILFTESPYEDDRQAALVNRAEPDLVLVNDPTNLDRYRNGSRHAYYMPHAYDPDRHQPAKSKPTSDFTFVGTGYPSRIEFFEQCSFDGLDVTLAGNWAGLADDSPLLPYLLHQKEHCSPNDETIGLYQRARASVNLYRAARRPEIEANRAELAHGWAMGPRELELAACGTFFLREPRGEGDQLLKMLPTFTEPGEFSDLLKFYVGNQKARAKAAKLAREAVQDRTFTAHAARFLRLIN
jgi:spore maturation protein CgeB